MEMKVPTIGCPKCGYRIVPSLEGMVCRCGFKASDNDWQIILKHIEDMVKEG